MDPNQKSASGTYGARDYVAWGKSSGNDPDKYDAVAKYLDTLPPPACSDCGGPDVAHVSTLKSALNGGGRIYTLFKACEDGCLPCVKKLIEEEHVDPNQRSTSGTYGAIDFVTWGH